MRSLKRFLLAGLVVLVPIIAFAQEAPEGSSAAAAILSVFAPMLEVAAGKFGWLAAVLVVMGVLRLVMKPLFTIVEAVVVATPSKDDDAFLEKVKGHAAYKWVAFILDWFASIKLPKKAE